MEVIGLKCMCVRVILMVLLQGLFCNGCMNQERVALLQLKSDLKFPSVLNWAGLDCCIWEGIECNNTTGRVENLSLGFASDPVVWCPRKTRVNGSLFLPFQQLRSLDLSSNCISNWVDVPEGLERTSTLLVHLEVLDLSFNPLAGNSLSFLNEFSSLKSLNLEATFGFSDENSLNISEIGRLSTKLKNLEVLDLSLNNLAGNSLSFLNEFSSLKSLNLEAAFGYFDENSLNISDIERLSTKLKNLEVLDLSYNYLASGKLSSLSGFSSLKSLDLSRTWFIPTKSMPFIDLPYFKNLEHLSLDGASSLSSTTLLNIGSMTSLKSLSLHDCELRGDLHSSLDLCELVHLQELDISWNDLNSSIPSCFANLTSLHRLDLSYNNFQIPSSFEPFLNLSKLMRLSMRGCKFNGDLHSSLAGLCELVHLEELDISSSNLNGTIPSCFANLTSLRQLDLSDNHFQIPSSFEPFLNLSKLKYLDVNNNEIYAETKSNFMAPKLQLEILRLSAHGNGGGAFPKFIFHQRDLREVDITNVKMGKEFPSWLLDNNTELERLVLVNLSLSGPLQLPVHPHMHLSHLDMSENSLFGRVPTEIAAYFPKLEYLNMSSNQLLGSIPFSTGQMSALQVLDLSNNQLSGS